MSANTDETLVRMANQIATFFVSQPEAEQLEGVISHINRFWERRMRERQFARRILPAVKATGNLIIPGVP